MLATGVWCKVSAIIAVCGNNFCSFIADTRRVISSGDRFLFGDDDTQKIFKLNSNVLYGMTGLYDTHSSILAAVSAIQDLSHACVDDVKDCVLDYIEAHKYAIIKRNYLVGGKMPDGTFRVYEIRFDPKAKRADVEVRAPLSNVLANGKSTFGISLCLPDKATEHQKFYMSKVEDAILSSRTHGEILQKAAGVIGLIAKKDDTVGTNVMALSVFWFCKLS